MGGVLDVFTTIRRDYARISSDIGIELAAEALEKSKLLHAVSFAVSNPCCLKTETYHCGVNRILRSKSVKLWRINSKKKMMPRTRWNGRLRILRLKLIKEMLKKVLKELHPPLPSVVQSWNSLIHHVENLTTELSTTQEVLLAVLAEVSEDSFDVMDGQVTNLRGSTGARPQKLGPNLPALDLWTNITKLSDEVAYCMQATLNHPKPTGYDTLPQS
jgi:hypothetical protein